MTASSNILEQQALFPYSNWLRDRQSNRQQRRLGRKFKNCRVIILMADLDVRVMTTEGEMLRHFTLDPSKNYQARYLDIL